MTITKLLVISDVHRDRHKLEQILDHYQGKVDHVISLGDSELSLKYLQSKNIIAIKGNYPLDGGEGYHKILEYEQVKIFITHGHKFGVKWGVSEQLHTFAKNEQIDLVMYGHTHNINDHIYEGIRYINPGSVRQSRGMHDASYAIVSIDKKDIQVSYFDVKRFQEITI
jgi:putative phosphoesterase